MHKLAGPAAQNLLKSKCCYCRDAVFKYAVTVSSVNTVQVELIVH